MMEFLREVFYYLIWNKVYIIALVLFIIIVIVGRNVFF